MLMELGTVPASSKAINLTKSCLSASLDRPNQEIYCIGKPETLFIEIGCKTESWKSVLYLSSFLYPVYGICLSCFWKYHCPGHKECASVFLPGSPLLSSTMTQNIVENSWASWAGRNQRASLRKKRSLETMGDFPFERNRHDMMLQEAYCLSWAYT